MSVKEDGSVLSREDDFLQPLRQAEHGHAKAQLIPGGHRVFKLSLSAVDEDQVGQVGKLSAPRVLARRVSFLQFLKAVLQPPGDDLPDRREVVRALHRLDGKVPVGLVGRLAVDHHDHGPHGLHALRVGNVVSLDAPGRPFQAEDVRQLLKRALCARIAG